MPIYVTYIGSISSLYMHATYVTSKSRYDFYIVKISTGKRLISYSLGSK